MNKLLLIPLAVFLGLVVFLFVGLGRDPREVPSPLINKPAPDFQLPQLQEPTKVFSTQELRGKVYLLNFWGTWCIACQQEHPLLVEYARTGGVPIYGVDYKDERAAALRWLQQLGNPYAGIAFDAEGRTSIDYGVYGAPETFLIDRNGVIRFKQIGPITRDVWEKKIAPLAKQLSQ